jgi:hypothetical protein
LRPTEPLLYIDRAEEITVHSEPDEMLENPLNDHMPFHVTQTIPTVEVQPSQIDDRRLSRNPQSRSATLCSARGRGFDPKRPGLRQGSGPMTSGFEFHVFGENQHADFVKLVFQVVVRSLSTGESHKLLRTVQLFVETSIVIALAEWHRAVEKSTFRQDEVRCL